ncbi:MAG: deoxyribodipyrimidine photo-lyase [Candidatus Nanohaloarchaea archaeon]|nr:deoxyribodipyrimidine photo-lyase [Candidatus Nanohaloarchaea archaeon]
MTGIVWLRRALRQQDNTALVTAAAQHDSVLPCYIIDTSIFNNATLGYPRVRFWHDALADLQERMERQNHPLCIRQGNPADELAALVDETGADTLYFNRDYTPYARERDQRVEQQVDCTVKSEKDLVLFEKDEILTNRGEPYSVYSYYRDKWFERDKPRPGEVDSFSTPDSSSDPLPSVQELGFTEPEGFEWQWDPGREGGRQRLEAFMDRIAHYDNLRDSPDQDATSRLSPHLRFGTVSIREAFWEAERMRQRVDDEEGIRAWQEQLAWRDFYMQFLWHHPETTDRPYQRQYESIDWHWDREHQRMWEQFTQGRTGFPFIDAGIRQLLETGWMHNRCRMAVTSFAAKDLHVDWRRLHEFFKQRFVDADIALMVGGIQWAYSNGTDAQPYFRVFNPWKQGEQHDPDGTFIRDWVPALADVPDKHIHRPYRMPDEVQQEADCRIGEDYPEPIVDHSQAREEAIAMFKEARDDDDT